MVNGLLSFDRGGSIASQILANAELTGMKAEAAMLEVKKTLLLMEEEQKEKKRLEELHAKKKPNIMFLRKNSGINGTPSRLKELTGTPSRL